VNEPDAANQPERRMRRQSAHRSEPDLAQADLSEDEVRMAGERSRPAVGVVHEAVRQEGEEQLSRPSSALAWSGLAAGLSMGFTLVAQGLLRTYLPDASWTPLIWRLGYPLGFLIVILGRQELFTETTLTAVVPLLAKRDAETLRNMLRIWGIVLVANLIGAVIFAMVVAHLGVFDAEVRSQFSYIGMHAATGNWGNILIRAVFAGWLIALILWLMPLADGARVWVIVVITYIVGLGSLSHSIAGSVEVMYAAATGDVSWARYLGGFLVPTLIGNTIGGASLVAALNTAQVVSGTRRAT
jgi:formate/nitrite transporter FocA (FNT family)